MGAKFGIIAASSSEVTDALAKLSLKKKLETSNFCTEPSVGKPDLRLCRFLNTVFFD